MPRYNFFCDSCGNTSEKMISFADFEAEADQQMCQCGSETPLRRIFAPPRYSYVKGAWTAGVTAPSAEEYIIKEREATTEKKSSW